MRDRKIGPARPDEWVTALSLVHGHLAPEECLASVAAGLDLISGGEIEADGVIVRRVGGRVVGAVIATPTFGRAGVIWPPGSVAGTPVENAAELTRHATRWLWSRGVAFVQCLFAPGDAARAEPLRRIGFRRITTFLNFRHGLGGSPDPGSGRELWWSAYSEALRPRFVGVLGRTYHESRDCPELNGLRGVEDSLDGHRGPAWRPESWRLATDGTEDVGLILLTDHGREWEISYVGVVPGRRGRGVGRAMVRSALSEARGAKANGVTVGVDARNEPALRLYRSSGFGACGEKDVYLLEPPGPSAG